MREKEGRKRRKNATKALLNVTKNTESQTAGGYSTPSLRKACDTYSKHNDPCKKKHVIR